MGCDVRTLFVGCIITCCFYLVTIVTRSFIDVDCYPLENVSMLFDSQEQFLVKSGTCLIPKMDPFDATLKQFVNVKKLYECSTRPDLTYRVDFKIIVNTSAFSYFKNFSHCEYTPFVKKTSSDTGCLYLDKNMTIFNISISADHAFARVKCYNTSYFVIQTQIYAFIIRNHTLDSIMKERYMRLAIGNFSKPLNLLLFGFESTSRMNFVRHMDSTRSFILDTLGGVEMFGYNKLGLNTFPNKVAAFLGITEKEMKYDQKWLDKYPFIWKNFSNAGYRTFYTEDDIDIATFHYLKSGFKSAPVDHYLRTYMDQIERTERKRYCSGRKTLAQYILESAYDYINTYNDVPHYMDLFISDPMHENVNGLGILDSPYLDLLTELQRKGFLNNTIMILYGDHGIRHGSLRSTFQGRLEEQLPVLIVVIPDWLKRNQPHLLVNLRNNAHKLTSNFDIYATLLDILYIGQSHKYPLTMGKYGTSLFRNIKSNRTCSQLKIPESYCSCSTFYTFTDLNNKVLVGAVQWLLNKMNHILFNATNLCVTIELDMITRASKSGVSCLKSKNNHKIDFIVNFKVKPSGGIFEGTVRYEGVTNKYTSLGTTQRLNKYGTQSYCVSSLRNGNDLERICYCKKQL